MYWWILVVCCLWSFHLHLSVSLIQPFILCPFIESLCCFSSFLNAYSNSACMGWMLVYVPSLRIYSLKFSFLFLLHIHQAFSLVQHSFMQGTGLCVRFRFHLTPFFFFFFIFFTFPFTFESLPPLCGCQRALGLLCCLDQAFPVCPLIAS